MATEIMEERSLKRFSLLFHSVSVLHMLGVKKKRDRERKCDVGPTPGCISKEVAIFPSL